MHTRPRVVVAIGVGACLGATVGSGEYVARGVGDAVRVAVGSGLGVGVRVASALITIRYTPYGSLAGGSITLVNGVG